MPLQTKELFLNKGFNTVFNRIENCKFVAAPFDQYINTGYWYAEKRDGLKEYQDLENDIKKFLNYVDSGNNNRIGLTSTKIIEYTDSSHAELITGLNSDIIPAPIRGVVGGTLEDSGTASGGSSDSLIDSTKTWSINEYAGYFIWIQSGTGAGDVQLITSNTADTITVGGWTGGVTPDATSVYKIYDQLALQSFLLSSKTDDNVKLYDGSVTLKETGLPIFNKAVEYDGRMWFINTKRSSIIYYSEIGQPLIIDSFIDTGFSSVIDLKVVGDYLVVSRNDKMLAIKKEVDSDGATTYSLSTLVEELGQISEDAIGNFNNGCYFISNDQNLYSLSITTSENGRIKGEIKNQGDSIRGYLDRIVGTESFKFINFKNNLHIIISGSLDTIELVFDLDLEGWLVNTFNYVVIDAYSVGAELYYGIGSVVCNLSGKQDLLEEYEQIISFMFGLESQFNMHKISLLKFTIGAVRDTYFGLQVKPYTKFGEIGTVSRNINLASMINEALPDETEGGMGLVTLGSPILGGTGLEVSNLARVGIIEKKVENASWGFITEVIISDNAFPYKNGFILGGVLIGFVTEDIVKHIPEMVV